MPYLKNGLVPLEILEKAPDLQRAMKALKTDPDAIVNVVKLLRKYKIALTFDQEST